MTIICGPIVRRVNRSSLNIWQVINEPLSSIGLKVYESQTNAASIATAISHRCIQVGEHCYVVLVSANINPSDTCKQIYYDVVINDVGFGDNNFYTKICLANDTLPSIAIPFSHQNLCQASCRKPHDDEGIDQLAALADILTETLNSDNRPSQLFLTGDQIYADDVSPILLHSFVDVRQQLGMASEAIFTKENRSFDPDRVKLDGRSSKVTKKRGFTSGEKDSHLLTFAEYFCMYLFSFGAELPNQKFASHRKLKPRLTYKNVKKSKRTVREYSLSYHEHKQQLRSLNAFKNSALYEGSTLVQDNRVRKVLANISVYMMFDDHDVTDDWNLTEINKTNLESSILGRQVYVNALSAYFLCQHWGNQPEDMTNHYADMIEALALEPDQANHFPLETLFSKYWGYQLKQTPPALVLDTRTQRVYNGDKLELISTQSLNEFGQQLAQLPPSKTLLLVSPTPVYGFSGAEAMQLKLPLKMQTALDREPWIASETALLGLQAALSKLPDVKQVVIFSGDVHYGFSRRKHLENEDLTFWQLCSSAACNSPAGGSIGLPLLAFLGKYFEKEHTKYLWPKEQHSHFLTRHKNIGAVSLNNELTPVEAILYCRNPDGEPYKKTYDLLDYKEY